MKNFILHHAADDLEIAQEAAQRLTHQLKARAARAVPPPFLIALSGGRIAGKFFSEIRNGLAGKPETLRGVHFFWADERCVPPDHADSSFLIAEKELLSPLRIPARQIHRIQGELTPAMAAHRAIADLQQLTGINCDCHYPVFDLIVLGMGEDGHVASLFPGSEGLSYFGESLFHSVVATKPPPQRVTMGYQLIAESGQVWVLASGIGKKDAWERSISHGVHTPLGQVLELRQQTEVWIDWK